MTALWHKYFPAAGLFVFCALLFCVAQPCTGQDAAAHSREAIPAQTSTGPDAPASSVSPEQSDSAQSLLVPVRTKEEGLARIKIIVQKFEAGKDRYLKSGYREAEVRRDFINPMLAALGWDAANLSRSSLFSQDTVPEMRVALGDGLKFLDYAQRINGRQAFSIEAKAAWHDIDHGPYQWQAHRYAWSAMRSSLAVLTNFKSWRVFDSRRKPDWQNPAQGEIAEFSLSFEEYPAKWDLLWTWFSKDSVAKGSIKMLLEKQDKSLERIPADRSLIAEIDRMRLELAGDIYANNKLKNEDELNEATQHILNRILFTRILEDRDIETSSVLRLRVLHWKGDPVIWADKKEERKDNRPLQEVLQSEFDRLKARYNGTIFGDHFSDKLKISDAVLEKIVISLYPDGGCPYDFSSLPLFVIGRVYENFLGRRIIVKDGKVALEMKPEVRAAGGTFYTSEDIARYIVRKVLADKLQGKTPQEMCKFKLVDPASGCGAFLAEAVNLLFAYAADYYRTHPEAITGQGTEFPDAVTLSDGTIKLSAPLKAELVKSVIYGVDIDPQATEIATMLLYIKILDNEGSAVVDAERGYKIPNRAWENNQAHESFKLPDLRRNLVCANALVEPDFAKTITDKAVIEKARPFDWRNNDTDIAKVMAAGGFDAVVGNPPYISYPDMKKLLPEQLEYLKVKYISMSKGNSDLAYAFVERGRNLLSGNGILSYILTNRVIYNQAALPLRQLIARENLLRELINFGSAHLFQDANVSTAILSLQRNSSMAFKYGHLIDPDALTEFMRAMDGDIFEGNSYYIFEENKPFIASGEWRFIPPSFKSSYNRISAMPNKVGDIATPFAGVHTGADKVFLVSLDDLQKFEKGILRPIIRDRGVKRYEKAQPTNFIIWPYTADGTLLSEETLKTDFPKTYEYLSANKVLLSNRASDKKWYALLAPRDNSVMFLPKLFCPWSRDVSRIGVDLQGDMIFLGSGRSCAIALNRSGVSIFTLLGILNSTIVRKYIGYISPQFGDTRNIYPVSIVADLPVPSIEVLNSSIGQQIEKQVKQIISVKEKGEDTTKLENEVDDLVRDLYGIPAEEVQPQQQAPAAEELKPAAQARQTRRNVAISLRSRRRSQPVEDFNGPCASSLMVA